MKVWLLILLPFAWIGTVVGAEAVTGSDYDLGERLKTKRWINFYPNKAIFNERVTFTFTGFWANRGVPVKVRLSLDSNCEEVEVNDKGTVAAQELTLSGRKATFLMPSNSTRDTNWVGGFCMNALDRWHFIDNTLELQDAYPETSELMQGFQNCDNFMHHKKLTVPNICGCYYKLSLPYYKETLERYSPITIPTTFDNRELLQQINTMHLVQGCCNRWTPIKEGFTIANTGPTKVWGYCSGHN